MFRAQSAAASDDQQAAALDMTFDTSDVTRPPGVARHDPSTLRLLLRHGGCGGGRGSRRRARSGGRGAGMKRRKLDVGLRPDQTGRSGWKVRLTGQPRTSSRPQPQSRRCPKLAGRLAMSRPQFHKQAEGDFDVNGFYAAQLCNTSPPVRRYLKFPRLIRWRPVGARTRHPCLGRCVQDGPTVAGGCSA
jgi:hypothetical protein